MLDLIGSDYVIDHVLAEHNVRMEDKVFRVYMTDLFKSMAESMNVTVLHRYVDLIDTPKETKPQKTGDEVALDVIRKLGLKVKGHDTIRTGSEDIA